MDNLLELIELVKYFPVPVGGVLRRNYKMCKAVDNVSLVVNKGDCFGIVGESGSGKTTLAKLILDMEKPTSGSILFEGKNIRDLLKNNPLSYRSCVQTIFQDAGGSLDPRIRVGGIVAELLEVQHKRLPKKVIQTRVVEMLDHVGLGSTCLRKYPHELSGGQKQRVAIARAMILEPELVILDEPVSALDVSIRAQILNLLVDIQDKKNLTYIIIAHDLAMLHNFTTQIAVMYLGKILEMGHTKNVLDNPQHPYTKALLAAVPRPEPDRRMKLTAALTGEIGNSIDPPFGCRFHPRCSQVHDICRKVIPPLRYIGPHHQVACYIDNVIN
jgi:oligopeptide/dipeptide ABC transporter ATP-binding protein